MAQHTLISLLINYSNLNDGANVFTIIGTNSCGDTTGTYTLNYDAPDLPCNDPEIIITTTAALSTSTLVVTGQSDQLFLSVTNSTSIGVSRDGFNHSDYEFEPSTGSLIVDLNSLNEGPNEFLVIAQNECGTNEKTVTVVYNQPATPEPCGPRFNPGNSDWEFCLITPSGTFNRNDLNSGFTYAGPASSVYFKPIAGGGEAIVVLRTPGASNLQWRTRYVQNLLGLAGMQIPDDDGVAKPLHGLAVPHHLAEVHHVIVPPRE